MGRSCNIYFQREVQESTNAWKAKRENALRRGVWMQEANPKTLEKTGSLCVNPHLVNRTNAWKAKRENALRRGGVYGKIITEAHSVQMSKCFEKSSHQ